MAESGTTRCNARFSVMILSKAQALFVEVVVSVPVLMSHSRVSSLNRAIPVVSSVSSSLRENFRLFLGF